jgi:DNA-binding NarL/FixJ family response regulator
MTAPVRILVIEDDAAGCRRAEAILQRSGYKVEVAADGLEGLQAMRTTNPDLVVCDIRMPGLDGFGVLAQAQADTALSKIPFIFLTALNEEGDLRRGMESGADDYLTKPFKAEELTASVQTRLRRVAALRKGEAPQASAPSHLLAALSPRESEILGLVGCGLATKEIASALGISPRTVDTHRASLMKKLGVRSATALARLAVQEGLA